MKTKQSKSVMTYSAKGMVYGNLWGGGKGGYPSKPLTAKTEKELLKTADKMLKDGSLDGGMGYESLIGAVLDITATETRIIEGKEFTHKDYYFCTIGELTEGEQQFLISNM